MISTYQPGDVANGHVLGDDGHWRPLPPPVQPRRDRTGLKIGGALAGTALLVLAAFGVDAMQNSSAGPASADAAAPAAVQAAPDPMTGLDAALTSDLGNLNRGDEGQRLTSVEYDETTQAMTVTYRLHDNVFHDGITGAGWNDAGWIIEDVRASGIPVQELTIVGTFGFIDAYGNPVGEKPAMTTTWTADTLQRIQPDNLTDDGMEAVAGSVVIHPDLQPR